MKKTDFIIRSNCQGAEIIVTSVSINARDFVQLGIHFTDNDGKKSVSGIFISKEEARELANGLLSQAADNFVDPLKEKIEEIIAKEDIFCISLPAMIDLLKKYDPDSRVDFDSHPTRVRVSRLLNELCGFTRKEFAREGFVFCKSE